ncbi:MAG: 4Fe-4S dicluster domain-containing protein [Gemmatimonadota bacterium]|nr:4Fe-4S dicluster domain-containing protein [Gemmatimonadota bacterium]
MSDGLKRRDFLKVLGVSGAGASIAGCSTQEVERLIPYVVPPEDITPGVATWYASVCQECSAGCGIRVRTREGRAVMIEGNPEHPVSAGGVCSRGVSALQSLYDPDRVATPMRRGEAGLQGSTWDDAMQALVGGLQGAANPLFLTGILGPTEELLVSQFVAAVGGRRVVFDPLYDTALREATRIAFGVDTLPQYDLANSALVVSFGADFLETWGSPVAMSRQFAHMHGVDHGEKGRFVFLGSRLSLTGQNADEWIPIPAGSEAAVALGMAAHLVQAGADAGPYADLLSAHSAESAAQAAGTEATAIAALANDLASAPSVVLGPGLAGSHRGAAAANLAVLVLNAVAGNVGQTVRIQQTQSPPGGGFGSLLDAIRSMSSGSHGAVVVAGTNPAYTAPAGAGFAEAFQSVGFKVAFSAALDETSEMADLVLPASHPLESWTDSMPRAGVYAVGQPAMRPVPHSDSRPMADVLLQAGAQMGHDYGGATTFRDYLSRANAAWLAANGARVGLTGDPEDRWRELLRTGAVSYDDQPPEVSALQPSATALSFDSPPVDGAGDLTLLVYPSSRFGDGTQANRPWLQELPDPVTKLMWHSWVEIHPDTAESLGVRTGDVVRVTTDHGEVEVPAWIYPGIRPDVVAIAMGGGHTAYGRFANGNGVNPMVLLPAVQDDASGAMALVSTQATLTPTGAWRRVATTEGSSDQDQRNIAPAVALAALGHAAEEEAGHHEQLQELQEIGGFKPSETEGRAEDYPLPGAEYGDYTRDQPRWAMSIDLDKCTGCSACVTACQAENNVPWVGENQILMGRDMHWMRIERYYEAVDATHAGTVDIRFLPMLCQHCNNAPCEPVCPVFAAYHTPDGLNGQAYNRCVGTRYCANNCPYKVRVFNWYSYTDLIPEPMTWQFNPDVTVRENGVMEKCSFCVQRIRDAGNRASVEGRDIRDGEVRPACQNSCPTGAIVFGNVRDSSSAVAGLVGDERTYRVLDELINTQPAVHYMKKVTHHEVDSGEH